MELFLIYSHMGWVEGLSNWGCYRNLLPCFPLPNLVADGLDAGDLNSLFSAGRNSYTAVHVQCSWAGTLSPCSGSNSGLQLPLWKRALTWITSFFWLIPCLLRFSLSSYCLPSAQAVLECFSATFMAKAKLEAGSHWSPTAERPDVPWGNLFACYQRVS